MSRKKIIIVIFLAMLFGNLFLGYQYYLNKKELAVFEAKQIKQEINAKTLNFTKLFIFRVLQADQEIDFDTRLQLENAIRELNDPEILNYWQNFTNSQTDKEAQESVKVLLEALINKIKI